MSVIYQDLRAAGAEKTSLPKLILCYFLRPEFKAVLYYRIFSRLYAKGGFKKLIGKLLWARTVKITGCYLSPKAKIGAGLHLPHATGIVIGDDTVIGDNATLYQHVTIGRKNTAQDAYPKLGNGVTVYAGACIVGDVKIGDGAVIGANSVVTKDVPAGATAVGAPAKILSSNFF